MEATDETLRFWSAVRDAKRELNRSLRMLGATFAQWRVLYATAQLGAELNDCVSQLEVAIRAGMDTTTTSDVMQRLEGKGWVDRAPDAEGFAWRVLVTSAGKALLEDAEALVARFSLALAGVEGQDLGDSLEWEA